jgi:8-oxo-dGTP diphosphatase
VTHRLLEPRTLEAAICDARRARTAYDNVVEWLLRPEAATSGPLAAERSMTATYDIPTVADQSARYDRTVRAAAEDVGIDSGLFEQFPPGRLARGLPLVDLAARAVPILTSDGGRAGRASVRCRTPTPPLAGENGQPAAWMRLDEPW